MPGNWMGSQGATLDRVREVMRSLGTSEPRVMTRGIAPLAGNRAGQWWAGDPSMGVPSKLRISPRMAERPTYQQIGVDVHELGHADQNPSRFTPRDIVEPRGVAYEQLFGPVVMRALGIRVPDRFWTSDQAQHGYRKEFGDRKIEAQKALLREFYGAQLYDREDVRVANKKLRPRVAEDSVMGPLLPHSFKPTRMEALKMISASVPKKRPIPAPAIGWTSH